MDHTTFTPTPEFAAAELDDRLKSDLWRHDSTPVYLRAVLKGLNDYVLAAKYPGDDQRHRGTSVATQLVHCQHMRDKAEAELAPLLELQRALTDLFGRICPASEVPPWVYYEIERILKAARS